MTTGWARRGVGAGLAGWLMALNGMAGSLTLTIDIPATNVLIELKGAYHVVQVKDGLFPAWDQQGSPRLPVLIANVLLPIGAKASGVHVECDDTRLASDVILFPVQPAAATGKAATFVPPDPRWYGSDAALPAERAILSGTQKMRGYSIASVALSPVSYVPLRGEVSVARQMTLTVDYNDAVPAARFASSEAEFTPNDHAFDESVAALVINPEAFAQQKRTPQGATVDDPRDYLVITDGSAMIDVFWRLAMYRATNDGFAVSLKSVSGINATYPGRDTQDRIRNCIRNYVNNHGTTYVVLGGDDTIVPDRDVWARVWETNWIVDPAIPADAYYSNLDGTWDANTNKVYGELADDVDFGVDVWVGRIPVRTAEQASNFVAKLMSDEKSVAGHSGNLLMGGVRAWDLYTGTNRPTDTVFDGLAGFRAHDPVTDTEMWARRLYRDYIQGFNFNPYRFELFTDTLTSRDSTWAGDYTITPTRMRTLLNEGWYHFFYDGHGSPWGIATENGTFSANDAAGAGAPPVGLFASCTCLAGAFDDPAVEPCFSEALLRNPDGGALAYVGSSRLGWGTFDPPPADNASYGGASYDFARELYRQVFYIQRTRLGSAFGNHKTVLAAMVGVTDTSHRWLEFSINLQGDPAMPLPSLTDITPPSPDPSSFAMPIQVLSSTSLCLTATTASDPSGVEYQFTESFGKCPPSAWQTNPVRVITGLLPQNFYTFRVQARDQSANHNLSGISDAAYAGTPADPGDMTAPTPNPMMFSSPPAANTPTSAAMTASTATDPSGVEYCFWELSGHPGGTSSGWQDSPSYTDTGLQPGTQYVYVVSARDKSSNHNQTTPSDEMAITPHGPDAWDPADDTGTTATALSAPIPMIQTHGPHMLSSSDLADWYSIRLSAGSSNMFSTPGGTGDNYGELFTDPHGVTRVAFNDDAAGGGQFRFTYVPTVTTTFYLRVRAVWAGDDCAYTLQWMGSAVDPNPPYPDPMRFATLPTAVSPSGVTMTAEAATDDSGVEYLFEETTGHAGGESGDWQDGPEFANTNLQPETTYGYRVRARDTSAAQNLTDWSEVRTVTTPPVVPHDLWDPTDDVGAGATSLGGPTPNEQTHGEHTLNGTDGDDWFAVELEAGTTNYIGATVEMGDPVAYLSRQPDGTELYAWDDDSGGNKAFLVQFTPPLSGTYYLRVIPYASSGPCIYTLTWRRGARVSDMTLAEALDTPGEVWGTYGDSNWVPQIDCTHDGIDAARAGLIGDNQTSILAKVVTGAGDIGFWWRASAELNYDTLSFAVDGVTNNVISGDTGWLYYIQSVGEGSHDLQWTFVKDVSISNYLDTAFVDQFSFTPTGAPPVMFLGGDAEWFVQTQYSHDGVEAHQSGFILSNQATRLQMFVSGPGTLEYWWKVSSENGFDILSVAADGATNAAISGEVGWQSQSLTLWKPGTRDITWTYQKDGSLDDGLDAGWVDEIRWTPIPMDRDNDGDQQPDWQEGMAGTDPGDSNSVFRFVQPLAQWRLDEGGIAVEWESSTGVFYNLERSEGLTEEPAFYYIQSHIPGVAGRTRYEDNPGSPGPFHYRVSVDP